MRKNGIFYSFEGKEIDKKTFPLLEDRDTAIVQTGQGKKEVLTFSGIVLEKNKVFVSFPKHFKVLDKDKVISDIQLLFKTIMKHWQENQMLYFTKTLNLKTNYPFQAFFNIYDYYQKFGIYHEEITETNKGYNGKISWKKTIKNSTKVVSKNGILFIPFQINKVKKKQVLVSECMAYAIDFTLQQFSLFLKLPRIGGWSLKNNLIKNKTSILKQLYDIKSEVFKDIDKKLISNLISFFEQVPKGGSYYLKHYTFSAIWEKMVENYLNFHFVKVTSKGLVFDETKNMKNKFRKAVFYPNGAQKDQNIQPDHYFEKGNDQFIFDAKYYNKIVGINYKQVAYYFFLEKISDRLNCKRKFERTYNALILPGDCKQKIHFKFDPKYNSDESDFRIYEYYLNVKKAMVLYLNEK